MIWLKYPQFLWIFWVWILWLIHLQATSEECLSLVNLWFMILVTIFSSYLWVWFRDTVCLIAGINASVFYKQPNLAIGSLGKSKVRGTRRRLYSVCSATMICVMVKCWIFIYWSVFQLRTLTSLGACKINDDLHLDPLT